ncbi:MAG: tetratricopeptide repeat protein [Bacillota bacterium]
MLKKIIIITLFILLISSSFLLAAGPTLEEIQTLVNQGKTGEALQLLEDNNINSNSDLKFYKGLLLSWNGEYARAEAVLLELVESNPNRLDTYNQLGRIYGWQREFEKAEKIIKKAQNIKYSSERTALLSKHAEWQQNYFKAQSLIENAIAKAESAELKAEYQESLNRIKGEIKAILYLEGRAVYSDDNKEDLELTFGIEKLLRDGINLKTSTGINYFEDESNFVFKSEVETSSPFIAKDNFFSSEFVFYNGGSKDKYELNNSFDHLVDNNNLWGINFNLIKDNDNSDYQILELEYEHRFEKTIMVLKNTSRHDDSDFIGDFAQHIDFYYPRDNYLLNLALSHYENGDYVFKVGFEFSDVFSGNKFDLSSLNLWFNTEKVSNLDFRMDLK